MTVDDIRQTILDWVGAANRAIDAGFDGVELHAAGGYLLDQFLEDNLKIRTDAYGGSVQNRARFVFQLMDAIIDAIGAYRVGARFSSFFFANKAQSSDDVSQFKYVFEEVEKRGIAYTAMIEPSFSLSDMLRGEKDQAKINNAAVKALVEETRKNWTRLQQQALESGVRPEDIKDYLALASFRPLLKTTLVLVVGGYSGQKAIEALEEGQADAVCFGRWFISSPNLVDRVRYGRSVRKYNRSTFYTHSREGYTNHPV